ALGAERRTRGPPRGRADLQRVRPEINRPMTLAGAPFGAPPRLFSARAALSREGLDLPDQPTLGGGTVVSPRRSPGSPECRVTSPARRNRPSLHPPNVSGRRPSPSEGDGICPYFPGFVKKVLGTYSHKIVKRREGNPCF